MLLATAVFAKDLTELDTTDIDVDAIAENVTISQPPANSDPDSKKTFAEICAENGF